MLRLFILVAILLCPALATAQELGPVLTELNARRLELNADGMVVLMSWASANILAGGAGWALADDPRWRGFHQMNLGWGAINLGIAAFGYVSATGELPPTTVAETIAQSVSIQKVLLFNAGLDLGYVAAGWAMWERGQRKDNAQLRGFGQSIVLQGAFLFAFDLTLELLHQGRHDEMMMRLGPWLGNAGQAGAALSAAF